MYEILEVKYSSCENTVDIVSGPYGVPDEMVTFSSRWRSHYNQFRLTSTHCWATRVLNTFQYIKVTLDI